MRKWTHYFPFPEFRPHQEETLFRIIDALEKKRFVILQAPCGCHAKGTPILLYDGSLKAVEEIVVGDVLVGPDSTPRKVLALHRGRDVMAKITPLKGEPFVVNQGHILSLQRYGMKTDRKRRADWGGDNRVTNISVKDYLQESNNFKYVNKLYRVPVTHWTPAALPIPPYLLGVWLGDGTSNKPEITNADDEVLSAWSDFGESWGLSPKRVLNTANCPQIYLSKEDAPVNKLVQTLKSLQVWKNKHIPGAYLTASTEQRLELLAGLIDTDGHCSSNTFDFISSKPALADGVVFLARSLGLAAYLKICQKHYVKDGVRSVPKTYYRVSISGNRDIVPCRVLRKTATERLQQKSVLRTSFTIELLPEDDYFGFEVDGDHLYLMGDFTVTHNSGKSSTALGIAHYYDSAYLATVQKQLQDQYVEEYREDIALLKGKSNYVCSHFSKARREVNCASASCGLNVSGRNAKLVRENCESKGSCAYINAKNHAIAHPRTLLNFSNLLAFSNIVLENGEKILPFRKILIVDEGHKLESELYSFAEISFTAGMYEKVQALSEELHMQIQEWSKIGTVENLPSLPSVKVFAENLLKEINEYLTSVGGVDDLPADEVRQVPTLRQEAEKISTFLADVSSKTGNWKVKPAVGGISVCPLHVDHLHQMAFSTAEKVLIMSGTILDPKTFAKNLGIKEEDYEYIEVPSTFPPENNIIMSYPVGSMAHHSIKETFPRLVKALKLIAKKHANEKGVIQTFNYRISEMLQKEFGKDPRFLFHTRETDKAALLDIHFRSKEPTVLVGPGFKEGVDFKGHLCTWQALCKMPCPDLKDPIVAARQRLEAAWYDLLVAMDIMQMLGRPVRSETDKAFQYVLDSYFPIFYKRNRRLFPKELQKSVFIAE